MDINFLNFNKKYSNKFYDLNIEWLESYFYVEKHDRSILSNPEDYIINKGGSILFVSCSNKIVGTVALMPTSDIDTYELTKMAVDPSYRGEKIGQRLLEKIISIAREKKLSKIILYSNKKLENAIYLYNKYKFIEIQLEKNCPYKRANIKMELSI